MAKTFTLKTHDDEFPNKRRITNEEIDFLKNLQHRINTQDHVYQADPRYWVIRDYKKVYGEDLNHTDGFEIVDKSDYDFDIFSSESGITEIDAIMETVKQKLIENENESFDDWDEEKEAKWKENVVDLSYDADSFVENLNEFTGSDDYIILSFVEIPVDRYCFFSHEEAINYLKAKDYHFTRKAHTYAMTTESEDIAKLIKLLHEVDFDISFNRKED